MTCPLCGGTLSVRDESIQSNLGDGSQVYVLQVARCRNDQCETELRRWTPEVEFGAWHQETWLPVTNKLEQEPQHETA